ncbi:ChbG/HpnK family deacetylase [Roseateles oligotrophus]|uniref:ChbG/HpnK family deacetylase n=1 Tax=Roseateles oligotrophus TaxID=1769250 RepID=A0ABT2YDI1_9BURK|nr:ChbG/HpnK family deacetylase [Roseateles oligotrophus]MCV2368107.1 ChbG/HpnK family deacetylase [Roseateles oligotrophus]
MKHIQICADDYGFDAAISQGILECIDAGRISATGCMVLSPAWPQWAPALRERQGLADYGLHLDLNEFAPYAEGRSLSGWIAASYLRRLDAGAAGIWVNQQLDAFESALRESPAFVDGHQHLHQLPIIREALLAAVSRRYGKSCALRSTRALGWRGAKARVIESLGALALRRGARSAGLRMNSDFAGVYDFSPAADYSELVSDWLATLADGGLLMTHPGRAGGTETRPDAIRPARERERAFWLSAAAGELLASQGVQLGLCEDWPLA